MITYFVPNDDCASVNCISRLSLLKSIVCLNTHHYLCLKLHLLPFALLKKGHICFLQKNKILSMIRKYHNHKLQTNPWKSHTTIIRHQEHKQSKATSSLLPIEMIAKLKWTQSNAQQNIEQLQNPTMGATINNESTTREPPTWNGQQPKPLGGLNAFFWYQILALASLVCPLISFKYFILHYIYHYHTFKCEFLFDDNQPR